jgi:hypothetical protein
MSNVTPGYALSGMPEAATDFIQGIERPTQLTAWTGDAEPFKDDPTVYNAMMAGREALVNGAAKIKALTADLTRNEPQKHEAGGEVSAKTVAKLEESQRIIQAQANAYQAGGDEALRDAFAINDGDKWLCDHWLSYVGREAKNQDGGFANIRKAATTHRELAAMMMKMPAELLGLPGDFLQSVRVKAVERFHPEIQQAWQRAEDLRDIAGRYTSLAARVKLNFHNPTIARKMATRVNV